MIHSSWLCEAPRSAASACCATLRPETEAMTAISATIFLISVHWTLLTTRILECMTELQFAQASAFSVVLILIVFAASGLISLMFRLAYPRYSR